VYLQTVVTCSDILLPSKNTTYIIQQHENILKSWQHFSAVKSHHQAKIEQNGLLIDSLATWDTYRYLAQGILTQYLAQGIFRDTLGQGIHTACLSQ
jgi:hypothetical protein